MADTDERTDEEIIEDGIKSIQKVKNEIQNLALDKIVTMYELDFSTILDTDTGNVSEDSGLQNIIRFSSDCLEDGSPIIFGGYTYTQFPIEAEGFEKGSEGTMPTPTIKVSNVLGGVSSILQEFNDLVGATVRRIRTFRKFLDDQPTADPDSYFPIDEFIVNRKTTQNKVYVEWELRSVLDLEGKYIPKRVCLRNICTHRYRLWRVNTDLPLGGQFDYSCAECPYTGDRYFDKTGGETNLPSEDKCGKRLSDCKARFGADAELPFGGFPGMVK